MSCTAHDQIAISLAELVNILHDISADTIELVKELRKLRERKQDEEE